jgi:hypothetical protein
MVLIDYTVKLGSPTGRPGRKVRMMSWQQFIASAEILSPLIYILDEIFML